jgi:hypothetical protein
VPGAADWDGLAPLSVGWWLEADPSGGRLALAARRSLILASRQCRRYQQDHDQWVTQLHHDPLAQPHLAGRGQRIGAVEGQAVRGLNRGQPGWGGNADLRE